MHVSVIRADGVVVVDGVARWVDLSDMDASIHAIQFDRDSGLGHVEYEPTATRPVTVRDFDAEVEEDKQARKNNKVPPRAAKERSVRVPRGVERNVTWGDVVRYYNKWVDAEE